MRKSGSRTSKVSTDAQDLSENPFPGISDSEWHEFLEEEETSLFILGVREEIFQKCMEICLKNYLEKQAVSFTVHCAYLAWCKVFNIYSMYRDPGDTDNPEVINSWKPDPEPSPSPIDSWGTECIETLTPDFVVKKQESNVFKPETKLAECVPQSLESCSFVSDLFDPEEGEYMFFSGFNTPYTNSKFSHQVSIFTKTLSMSRESLPVLKPLMCHTGHYVRSHHKNK